MLAICAKDDTRPQHGSATTTTGTPQAVLHAIAVLRGIGPADHRPLDERESEALATIYRSFGPMLLSVARAIMKEREEAEDVLHEVFCRLPWSIWQYRDGGFGGWLRQVTARTALMKLRASRRRGEVRAVDMHEELAFDAPARADFQALDNDDLVRRALGELSDGLRQVVVLRLCLDYSHEEIAETLDITTSASEVRLCRALKQLRRSLRAQDALLPGGHRLI